MSDSAQNFFDVQFATNQFSGNQLLLQEILKKFIQQYIHFDTLLVEYFQQQNISAVKQDIHTVKGVSGNLGMKALHKACKELEMSLVNPLTERELENFLQIFRQTLTLIQNFTEENVAEDPSETATKLDCKTELVAALKRNEFISESKMQSYSESLDLSSDKLDDLKQAIDSLDYLSAIALLE